MTGTHNRLRAEITTLANGWQTRRPDPSPVMQGLDDFTHARLDRLHFHPNLDAGHLQIVITPSAEGDVEYGPSFRLVNRVTGVHLRDSPTQPVCLGKLQEEFERVSVEAVFTEIEGKAGRLPGEISRAGAILFKQLVDSSGSPTIGEGRDFGAQPVMRPCHKYSRFCD